MVLFDSLLAFALTLAALATVVTLLLEFAIRICGLKRKGQVALFEKLLDSDTVKELLPAAAGAQWDIIKAIVRNPFSKKEMADSKEAQKYAGTAAAAIYREVSLEHVLRRLLESEAAKDMVAGAKEELEPKLHAIARRYDELSSALGAEFKRNAQWWSLAVGIGLAVVMNADGTRLLQAYLQDSSLRDSVIEKISPEAVGAQDGADAETAAEQLSRQLSLINELALPVGNGYFPHCFLLQDAERRKASADPLCRTAGAAGSADAWLGWLLKVLFTGVLIGLGAPFWYDVARRLAAVRSAFKGTPASEERHRGADAAGDPDQRDRLIKRIAAETAQGGKRGGGRRGGSEGQAEDARA